MGAKYIYRMDDITPYMNWNQFWKYIQLFKKNNVKPLLGIVPHNQDLNLIIQEKNTNFWEIMRSLQNQGIVEIAQHGYQHKVVRTKEKGLMNIGFNGLSEYVGHSYEIQYKMIKSGRHILRSEGINTDVWMAPCHSFDTITLQVLANLGFRAVTDGIALYPFKFHDLVFVPQQLWAPRYFPFGIFTICLHINQLAEGRFEEVKRHLESGANIISFSQAIKHMYRFQDQVINCLFKWCYMIRKKIKKLV
ncbi:DUF2334 domain-containing protein [Clostridiaceae bacterium 35-E11]